jgi:predicted acetyltransferase
VWWDIEVLADFKWARRGFDRKFYALHETDGEADAYAMYRVKHDWSDGFPNSELHVQEIMARDGAALREMWRFVFGVDLIKRITTRAASAVEPLLLMLTEPRRLNLRERDGMWLRVVDVAAALEARAYAADGSVVFDLRDEYMPPAGGRFRLTASGGRGRVERSDDPVELRLDAADLGAVYLGGFSLAELARAGRTDELVAGARARLDAMLVTAAPAWCPQIF